MLLNRDLAEQEPWRRLPAEMRRWAAPLLSAGLLVGLSLLLYYPFAYWYGQGYSEIDFWQGPRTPLYDYFIHWGIFLFLIFSWMVHETLDWMAKTPVSALRRLQPYQTLIWLVVVGLALLVVLLGIRLPGFEPRWIYRWRTALTWPGLPCRWLPGRRCCCCGRVCRPRKRRIVPGRQRSCAQPGG